MGSGSDVRRGVIDQRDRATKRRRDQSGEEPDQPDDLDLLNGWLEEFVCAEAPERTIDRLKRLPFREYLQLSARFDVSPPERLRWLAIAIEDAGLGLGAEAWLAADRFHREAIRLAPDDSVVHASRALTALHMIRGGSTQAKEDERLQMACAESMLATRLEPCGHTFSVAAECHYAAGDSASSLELCDQAIVHDPDRVWPRIYRAYCLHDLERWEEAALAYAEVPLDQLVGHAAWRGELLVAQRADCLRRAGLADQARAEYERVLTRWEQQPALTTPRYLEGVSEQWPDLAARIDAIRANTS